jgi:hypothetical protein
MSNDKFDRLVQQGIILKPEAFTEGDRQQINALTPAEVEALISIRGKLGEQFLQQKATGPNPSMAIVF